MSDEEYVRSEWKLVHCRDDSRQSYPRGRVWVQDVDVHWSDFASWAEAAEFTHERKEEIRQLQREIEKQKHRVNSCFAVVKDLISYEAFVSAKVQTELLCVEARILARLEPALAELKKGMKL